jgi:hypothetical protein
MPMTDTDYAAGRAVLIEADRISAAVYVEGQLRGDLYELVAIYFGECCSSPFFDLAEALAYLQSDPELRDPRLIRAEVSFDPSTGHPSDQPPSHPGEVVTGALNVPVSHQPIGVPQCTASLFSYDSASPADPLLPGV